MPKRGAKRKTATAAEQANNPKAKATATRAPKRVKASKPKPEYVEEQRNYQDLWRLAFPVGTEWDRLDSVYNYDWDFSNLEKQFEEEDGIFHNLGGGGDDDNKVYIFAATETSSAAEPVLIPTLIAVVAPRPPSHDIGIRSVQREAEEIVPMKEMKMDWIPYIPLEDREGWNSERASKSATKVFVLGCTQRKASLKHMKEDRWMKFQYCMPYVMNPNDDEVEEQSTEVDIMFPQEPNPPLFCGFDWEFDEVEEKADEKVESGELAADKKEEFMEFVKEEVRNAKKKNREEREARKKKLEDPKYQEAKAYFQSMKVYKIYPLESPNTPKIEKSSPYINYYFRSAHKVIGARE